MRPAFCGICCCAAVLLVVLAGHGLAAEEKDQYPASAEEVVKAMVTAAMAQDIEGAQKFMDADWIASCNFIYKKKGGVKGFWAQLLKDFTAEKVTFQASKVEGDVTKVPVHLENKDKSTMATIFRCQKKDGRWTVLGN
jgi:hypothetical protein